MAHRSEGEVKIIDQFAGVNDHIAQVKLPDDLVRWAQGGFFNKERDFQRLNGKLVVDVPSTMGMVLTIKQLDFTSSTILLYHASTLYQTDIASALVEDNSSVLPTEPFI